MKSKKFKLLKPPKKLSRIYRKENDIYAKAAEVIKTQHALNIDAKLKELKLEEKNAVGSKLTATLKAQNLLHELKADIILA